MEERVTDNSARQRFELQLPGGTAFLEYRMHGGLRVLTHAEVPVPMRGSGVAARLTAGALDLMRSQGERVVPRCPYVVEYIARHPQYQDLLGPG